MRSSDSWALQEGCIRTYQPTRKDAIKGRDAGFRTAAGSKCYSKIVFPTAWVIHIRKSREIKTDSNGGSQPLTIAQTRRVGDHKNASKRLLVWDERRTRVGKGEGDNGVSLHPLICIFFVLMCDTNHLSWKASKEFTVKNSSSSYHDKHG